MADYEVIVNKKRMAGIAIVVVGLILGMLAYILDLVTTGKIHSSSTPLYLLLGGLMISVLGAIYIGAGSTEAIRLLNKQVKIMKAELSEKERTIDEQKKGIENLSDNRLTGLSQTVDRLDMLEKEDAAKAAAKPPEKPADAAAPKQAWEKNLDAKRTEKTAELPPPPPKSMVVPGPAKPVAPQALPPPPPGMPKGQALPPPPPKSMQVALPPKPHEQPAPPGPVAAPKPVAVAPVPMQIPKPVAPVPAVIEPKPSPVVVPKPSVTQEDIIDEEIVESEDEKSKEVRSEVEGSEVEGSEEEDSADEGSAEKRYEKEASQKAKAEKEEYENEKAEVEADAAGMDEDDLLPTTTCPKCSNTFKGDWEHCPFCDFNLKVSKVEAPAVQPPKTEPAQQGIPLLGFTPKRAVPVQAVPPQPVPEATKVPPLPPMEKPLEIPRPVEAKPAPVSIIPPLPDFSRSTPSVPTPPAQAAPPPNATAPAAEAVKDKCPSCNKAVKPHWRNCPYCKATLK